MSWIILSINYWTERTREGPPLNRGNCSTESIVSSSPPNLPVSYRQDFFSFFWKKGTSGRGSWRASVERSLCWSSPGKIFSVRRWVAISHHAVIVLRSIVLRLYLVTRFSWHAPREFRWRILAFLSLTACRHIADPSALRWHKIVRRDRQMSGIKQLLINFSRMKTTAFNF